MAIPRHTPYNLKTLLRRALLPTPWAAAGLLLLAGCGSPPPPQPPAGAKTPEAPPAVELGAPESETTGSVQGGAGTSKAGE